MQCRTKFIIGLFATICTLKVVEVAIDESLREDIYAIYIGTAIPVREILNGSVTEDQITFYLYTSENSSEYTQIYNDNLEVLRDTTNQIVFLIHGWTNSRETAWMEIVKNALLVKDPSNIVIQVDWEVPASANYYVAAANTYDVGVYVSNLLVNLNQNYGVDKNNFLLIGNSLGAQVAGFVGKMFKNETSQQLPRIIALDAAGPLFAERPTNMRLYETDAEVVAAIHTAGGTFGYLDSLGTIDFFPNGGSTQPGCVAVDPATILTGSLDDLSNQIFCNHQRSRIYFPEGVLNSTAFISKQCNSYLTYTTGLCVGNTVAMVDLTTTLTGDFYLKINANSPYSK